MQDRVERAVKAALPIGGWMAPEELEWLAQNAFQKKRIIELGSFHGRSTKAIAMATDGKIFAVDTWEWRTWGIEPYQCFLRHLAPEIMAGKVIPLRMTTTEAAVVLPALLGEEAADMVFDDAAHTLEDLQHHIEAFMPLGKEGALFCGHDFTPRYATALTAAFGSFQCPVKAIWKGGAP